MIGDKIKLLREQKGYRLTEFAEMIGERKQNLYKYEKGIITNIPLDKIERMAAVLGVSPCDLAGWSVAPDDDKKLLNLYHSLNNEGKEKVYEYCLDLVDSQNYKKNSLNDKMEA